MAFKEWLSWWRIDMKNVQIHIAERHEGKTYGANKQVNIFIIKIVISTILYTSNTKRELFQRYCKYMFEFFLNFFFTVLSLTPSW